MEACKDQIQCVEYVSLEYCAKNYLSYVRCKLKINRFSNTHLWTFSFITGTFLSKCCKCYRCLFFIILTICKKQLINYKFLWTKNGCVYMRKEERSPIILISNKEIMERVWYNLIFYIG